MCRIIVAKDPTQARWARPLEGDSGPGEGGRKNVFLNMDRQGPYNGNLYYGLYNGNLYYGLYNGNPYEGFYNGNLVGNAAPAKTVRDPVSNLSGSSRTPTEYL